jgi:hypothetical protein
MKRTNCLLIIALLASGTLFGQGKEQAPDTTKVKIGDLNVLIYENPHNPDGDQLDVSYGEDDGDDGNDGTDGKSELTHWGGIDLGVNMLINSDNKSDLGEGNEWLDLNPARSLSWNFNLYEEKIRIVKDYVGIITGLGLSYNSYGLRDSVSVATRFSYMAADSSGMITVDSTYGVFNSGMEFTKNKLRTSSLRVPVLLEFNTSLDNDKSFHVAAGVIGGWRFSTITKQKWSSEGIEHQARRKGDYNMNDFTLDATVRVGYKNFTMYATYGLTALFKEGQGPEVYPISVGLSIVPF